MLTGVVLTHNSELTLAACLESLRFCDQIVVVDDQSTDRTLEIAKLKNANVLQHPLSGDFSKQRNWVISQLKCDWILFIDSDEVVPKPLAKEIKEKIASTDAQAFSIPRIDILWGKKLTHGDLLNKRFIRLAKPSAGIWVNSVHETWQITGKVEDLSHSILHYPLNSIAGFLQKLNHYSTIRSQEFKNNNRQVSIIEIVFAPIYKFLVLYILKRGLLDGTPGFIHAMLMSFYVFLVAGKTYLLQRHD